MANINKIMTAQREIIKSLTPSTAQVFFLIVDLMGEDDYVVVSQKTAAKILKKSVPTVFRAVDELVCKDLLVRHKAGNLVVFGIPKDLRFGNGITKIRAAVVLSEAEQV